METASVRMAVIIIVNALMACCILVDSETNNTPNLNQGLVHQEALVLLNSDMNQLRSEIYQLNGELKSTMTQVQMMTEENQLLKSQVQSLTKDNQLLKNTVSQLKNVTEGNLNYFGDLKKGISNLKAELNNFRGDDVFFNSSLLQLKQFAGGIASVVFLLQFHNDWITDYKNETVMKFDNVVLNVGGGYDPATGIFTCPKAGLYLLSLRCSVDWKVSGSSSASLSLYKNDLFVLKCDVNDPEYGENDFVQVPVNLNKGDELKVQGIFTKDVAGETWTFLSGMLLVIT